VATRGTRQSIKEEEKALKIQKCFENTFEGGKFLAPQFSGALHYPTNCAKVASNQHGPTSFSKSVAGLSMAELSRGSQCYKTHFRPIENFAFAQSDVGTQCC
jgi:hypothetical protein